MDIPVENALAFFPPSVKAGNVTLRAVTLADIVRIGQLGVDIARPIPDDKLFQVAAILAGESDFKRFVKRARVGLKELCTAVENVLNDAFRTYLKPREERGGTIHLTPYGLGMPLEFAEFLCSEYGWSWESAINTPVMTALALAAAYRQRNGIKHAGFDYIERAYAKTQKRIKANG